MPDCPWCGEPYERFVYQREVEDGDSLGDVCVSGLGYWIHEEAGS